MQDSSTLSAHRAHPEASAPVLLASGGQGMLGLLLWWICKLELIQACWFLADTLFETGPAKRHGHDLCTSRFRSCCSHILVPRALASAGALCGLVGAPDRDSNLQQAPNMQQQAPNLPDWHKRGALQAAYLLGLANEFLPGTLLCCGKEAQLLGDQHVNLKDGVYVRCLCPECKKKPAVVCVRGS